MYNWQLKEWPDFRFDTGGIENRLFLIFENQGKIQGMLDTMPTELKDQSIIEINTEEILKSNLIEGELLDKNDVMSSIRNQLGLNLKHEFIKDKRAEGVVKMMALMKQKFNSDLSEEMLLKWHTLLMEPYSNIKAGQWRTGTEPMQIVSGAIGKEKVHFEAPPSDIVPKEMKRFIKWYNNKTYFQLNNFIIESAIAHLYFETIHPFEDGNGRIGRAISEKSIYQGFNNIVLISLSSIIEKNRNEYYNQLNKASKSLEITKWINYFIEIILQSQIEVLAKINLVVSKMHFFTKFQSSLNSRQEKALNKMFEAYPDSFKGGMSAKKYISINKCSKATATRDLQLMTSIGALKQYGKGRSVRYELNF